jgi:two-component system OmpR family response regulator
MTADGSSGARVLVIDDDEIVLEAIKALLVGEGYQVTCLVSPIGATQVIMTKQIQVVVVDLNMPVMQGDRFISLLRSWDKIREVPTVLLSSAAPATLTAVAKELPGVVTVSKSTMHRALPETLKRVLGRARGPAAGTGGASSTGGTSGASGAARRK